MASRLRDFTLINIPTFYGSKVEEVPQEFIDEVYMILLAMGLYTSDKAELSTYQLRDVNQVWYVQLIDNMPLEGGLVTCEIFNMDFYLIDSFLGR